MESIDPIKPKNDLSSSDLRTYKDRLVLQRKYNGCRSTCTIDNGSVELWSRAFSSVTSQRIPYTGKMPHIVEELKRLELPDGTILDGELVSLRGGDKDYFDDIKRCTNGHDETNVNFQKQTGYWASWMVFDITHFGGREVYDLTFEDRYELLEALFDQKETKWVQLVRYEKFNGSVNSLKKKAAKLGIEGYVAKNLDSKYPITTFGKARKPAGTWWKIVPDKVADVVITGFEYGTPGSKFQDTTGKLVAVQYDLEGNQIRVCHVGTGFDEAERDSLMYETYPKVARVKYRYRRPDSMKLIHPSWGGFRDDKQLEECIIEELL